jgi:signal transduction histidine kinase
MPLMADNPNFGSVRDLLVRGLSHDYKRVLLSLIRSVKKIELSNVSANNTEVNRLCEDFASLGLGLMDELDRLANHIDENGMELDSVGMPPSLETILRQMDTVANDIRKYSDGEAIWLSTRRAHRQLQRLWEFPFKECNSPLATFSVSNELQRILTDLAGTMAKSGCSKNSIELHVGAERLVTNRSLFNLAVSNVLANALIHSDKGPDLKLRITTTIRPELGSKRPSYLLAISDNGCGINEDDRAVLFQLFKQGGRAVASGQGSGMGLSFVRLAMNVMGGTFTLQKNDSDRTTFVMSFPYESIESVLRNQPV